MYVLQESTTDDNSTIQLYEQLGFSYPSLLQPLIHERDTVSLFIPYTQIKREKRLKNRLMNTSLILF